MKSKFPYVVVLDNIRSALNVGAIFRTCEAAGVSKLYLGGITPYPPHNRIPKTALGAVEWVEWERAEDVVGLIKDLKSQGYHIASVEQSQESVPFNQQQFPTNTALVFGHEIQGVNESILNISDSIVDIPMFGNKKSLNVATSVGILSYHLSLNFLENGTKTT